MSGMDSDEDVWGDEEVVLESRAVLEHISKDGYRHGKITGEDAHRQRGFDDGVRLGLVVGRVSGEFISKCAAHSVDAQSAVQDILQGLHEMTESNVQIICDKLSDCLKDTNADSNINVEEFRTTMLSLTPKDVPGLDRGSGCGQEHCCCSK